MEVISLLPHRHMDISLGGKQDRKQQDARVCAVVGGLGFS